MGAGFLCLGEAEITIPRFLADFARGITSGVYTADGSADLARTPVPRFDLVDHRDYLYMAVQYSRGCPHHCEFCNVIDLFDHRYRTKSPAQVLAELEVLYRLGYRGQVDFFDDNLVGHVPKAKALLRELAAWLESHGHPFQFSTSVTLNVAQDEELLALFRAARFKYFLVGIETPDPEALRTALKPQNTGFSIPEAVDRIYRQAGATVHSGFLLGLDDEAADIGDRIIQCIDATSIPWVMAGVVYPLPGTQLARRLDMEGRLFPAARTFDDEAIRNQNLGRHPVPDAPAARGGAGRPAAHPPALLRAVTLLRSLRRGRGPAEHHPQPLSGSASLPPECPDLPPAVLDGDPGPQAPRSLLAGHGPGGASQPGRARGLRHPLGPLPSLRGAPPLLRGAARPPAGGHHPAR